MQQCPKCRKEAADDHLFCGQCRTLLVSQRAMELPSGGKSQGHCPCGPGQGEVDADGFCERCGHRRTIVRDSFEAVPSVNLAAVSNKGMNERYPSNQDYMVVEEHQGVSILVLCDGVSRSQRPQDASEVAANTACASVKEALSAGASPKAALQAAVRAANAAVCGLRYDPQAALDPPSTTIVAAIVERGTAHVSWVGDSRAYWVSAVSSGLLTHDHSYINDLIDLSVSSVAEAKQDPSISGITRCLGVQEGGQEILPAPVLSMKLPARARLILCSDGLWGYLEDHRRLARMVRELPAEADAVTLARKLVRYARVQGGKDNITAAVVFLP